MYRWSGLVISREQGWRHDAGFAVPVLISLGTVELDVYGTAEKCTGQYTGL